MIYHWPCLVQVRPDTPDGGVARLPGVALPLEENRVLSAWKDFGFSKSDTVLPVKIYGSYVYLQTNVCGRRNIQFLGFAESTAAYRILLV